MQLNKLLLFNLLLIGIISFVNCSKSRDLEKQILDAILGDTYDKRIIPPTNGSNPVEVKVNIYVRAIEDIDDSEEEFRVQLTYRQVWVDSRLSFSKFIRQQNNDFRFIILTDTDAIWTPDIFFTNEKTGKTHDILMKNTFARIYPSGEVLYSTRITLSLSCSMNFRAFPFDRQSCSIKLASYGHTTEDIRINWKDENPIQVSSTLEHNEFSYQGFDTETCDSQTITGTYGCVQVDFEFKRIWNYYLIMVHIPCAMFIILSYLSFWIHPTRSSTARALTTLGPLLTMAVMTQRLNEGFPVTPYTKGIDTFTGISLTFSFITVLIFVINNYLSQAENAAMESSGGVFSRAIKSCSSACGWERIDQIMRLFYPVLFVLFIILYMIFC